MKRFVLLSLLFVMLLSLLPMTFVTRATETKTMDVYLVAGQSNAAGFTSYNSSTLEQMDSRYVDGFQNIYYAGTACNPSGSSANPHSVSFQTLKAGFGRTSSYIGPEVGIAHALSEIYNPTTGKNACIVKYAVGGTSIMNKLGGQNEALGNWVGPSYQATLTSGVTDKTGGLYRNFLSEVETRLAEIREAGYTPVIKGLYWMQGESDLDQVSNYGSVFASLVSDWRKDLSELTGEDLSKMPVVVGEISRTYKGADSTQMQLNKAFIDMQNTLPNTIDNCHVINSSVYDINTATAVVGSDKWHWNYEACIAVGKLAGEKFNNVVTHHVHDYNQSVVSDKYLKQKGNCTVGAVYYKSCKCGEKSTSKTFVVTAPGHIFDQEVVKDKYAKTPATCTEEGVYYKSCKCGVKSTSETFVVAASGHTFDQSVVSDEYLKQAGNCTDDAVYYKSCKCGVKSTSETFVVAASGHIFDQSVVSDEYLKQAGNCTIVAVYYKSCKCGEKSNETFVADAPGHIFDQEVVKDKYAKTPATCTEEGVYYKSCKCGQKSADKTFEVPKTSEHEYGDFKTVKEPTATEEGLKERTCEHCGDVQKEAIPVLEAPTEPSEQIPSTAPTQPEQTDPTQENNTPNNSGNKKEQPNALIYVVIAAVVVVVAALVVVRLKKNKKA